MKLRTRSDLRFYQRYMVERIVRDRFLMLWADMGLGKTVVTLTALQELLDMMFITKVLIVAPVLVSETTWPDEFAAWTHLRGMKFTVIRVKDNDPALREAYNSAARAARADALMIGEDKATAEKIARQAGQRAEAQKKEEMKARLVASDTPIHIINREQLPWLLKHLGKARPYDALVYDEASRLKSGKKRTKPTKKVDANGNAKAPGLSEFGALSRLRAGMECVIELSGTPASGQGLEDLWGQAYIVDQGERLMTSKTAFMNRWFNFNRFNYNEATPKEFAERQIMELLSDVAVTLRSEDYLELPDRIDNFIYVDMPPDAREKYRRLEREFLLEEHDVEAVNKGVLTNKLLQLSNGSLYDENKRIVEIHDAKLDALESVIANANGKPVLVAYSFQFDLEKIRKRFKHAVLLRDEPDVVRKWNAGKIPLLVTHPGSAAHGLNLQYGGNIAVWYGLTWSLELYKQFNKRLHRSGQEHAVVLHHILTHGTYDEYQLSSLRQKNATENSVTGAVRVYLKEDAEALLA